MVVMALCDSTDRARHVVNCSLQLLDLILMVMQAAIVNPFLLSSKPASILLFEG